LKSIILTLLLTCMLSAGEPVLTAHVDRNSANVGDRVTYMVELHFEQGWDFDLAPISSSLGDAVVHRSAWSKPERVPGTNLQKITLISTLSWYKLGEYVIPAFELKGSNSENQDLNLQTQDIEVEITSVLEEGDTVLSDSKPQIALKEFPLVPLILGLLLVIILVILYLWRRNRRSEDASIQVVPALPPLEEVNLRLKELVSGSILKEGDYKKFYVEISLIIRHFYGRVFDIQGDEMTSFELEDFFSGENLPGEFHEKSHDFSSLCDRVKFAKYEPREAENNEVVNLAYRLIHLLKPRCVVEDVDAETR